MIRMRKRSETETSFSERSEKGEKQCRAERRREREKSVRRNHCRWTIWCGTAKTRESQGKESAERNERDSEEEGEIRSTNLSV